MGGWRHQFSRLAKVSGLIKATQAANPLFCRCAPAGQKSESTHAKVDQSRHTRSSGCSYVSCGSSPKAQAGASSAIPKPTRLCSERLRGVLRNCMGKRQLPAEAQESPSKQAKMGNDTEQARLAAPLNPEDCTMEAWYMDDSTEDQRLPHRCDPNKPASTEQLRKLGVLQWQLDADSHEKDPKLKAIRADRNYSYQDVITIRKDTLPNYEEKLKSFFEEHLHTDEEIRYILEGSGYFDVRDADEKWIRVAMKKGDMIVLPEGIYHRFTLDDVNYVKAMRLFVGEPVWTPYNRPQDDMPARKKYVQEFLNTAAAQA